MIDESMFDGTHEVEAENLSALRNFYDQLSEKQMELPSLYYETVEENFWDLI